MTVEMNGKRELPKGWRWARLGKVCEIIAGQSPPGHTYRTYNEGLPFFQGKADFGLRYPIPRVWCIEPLKIALPGDILISIRAPVGPTNIADSTCCIGRGLAAIRVSEQADRDFVLAALRLYEVDLAKQGSGSTFDAINRDQLENLKLPLPPLPEQRRIATLLHEHLAAVEKARRAAQARLEAAQALPAALLREIFESEEARGWNVRKLGDVARIGSGVTLGKKYEGIEIRPVPYLRVANVRDGFLDLSDVNEIAIPELDIEKYLLCEGDLLLTEGGDPDKLGRGTYWQGQMAECIHQNHIFRVRFDLERFSPSFLSAQLGSAYGKAYFLAFAKQTTGIATINQQVLANFPLMVPAREVQDHIATRINKYTVSTEQAHNMLTGQCHAIDAIPAALLRMAFQGEL